MPELSRFYGIVIQMHYRDHEPPHVHVQYSDDAAVVDVNSLEVINGHLPRTARRRVLLVGINPPGRVVRQVGAG